jgi:hypothetical protein
MMDLSPLVKWVTDEQKRLIESVIKPERDYELHYCNMIDGCNIINIYDVEDQLVVASVVTDYRGLKVTVRLI